MNNRVKVLRVSKELLLSFVNGLANFEVLFVPVLEELPEGTKILDIQYSFQWRCFEALVSHWSFPEIPEGVYPPVIGGDEPMVLRSFLRKSIADDFKVPDINKSAT